MSKLEFSPGLAPAAQEYEFNKRERKRLELIKLVKQTRQHLILSRASPKKNSNNSSLVVRPGTAAAVAKNNVRVRAPKLKLSATASKDLRFATLSSGASPISLGTSPMKSTFEGSSSTGNKDEKFHERELRILTLTLDREIRRNTHFQAVLSEKEADEMRAKETERKRSEDLKRRMEEKIQQDGAKMAVERMEDRVKRMEVQEQIRREQEAREIALEKERMRESARRLELMEKERKRREVIAKAELLRKLRRDRFERNLKGVNVKLEKREKEQKSANSKLHLLVQGRKQREETVKLNAQQKEQLEEAKKRNDYATLCKKLNESNAKFMTLQQQKSESLRKTSQEREEKARKAQERAMLKLEEKAEKIAEKYYESDKRVESIHSRLENFRAMKQNFSAVDHEIKAWNMEHNRKKEEYFAAQIKKRLEAGELRAQELARKKQQRSSDMRKSQYQAELQRERLHAALQYMAVWNVWDMSIAQDIVLGKNGMDTVSIEEAIRRKSSMCNNKMPPRPGTSRTLPPGGKPFVTTLLVGLGRTVGTPMAKTHTPDQLHRKAENRTTISAGNPFGNIRYSGLGPRDPLPQDEYANNEFNADIE